MSADVPAEIAKLREQLRLCQLELAQVRREQEAAAEVRSSTEQVKVGFRQLATRLDAHLTKAESTAGRRGWIKRRLISTMPRATEDADLAVLRASKLMNGAWYFQRYPDVASTGLSAALHYLRHGAAANKDPGPGFSTKQYRAKHPELSEDTNPLVHFVHNASESGQ